LKVLILQTQKSQFYQHVSKLMKGKALRKHSLHGKTAASVLLKLFISGKPHRKPIGFDSIAAQSITDIVNV